LQEVSHNGKHQESLKTINLEMVCLLRNICVPKDFQERFMLLEFQYHILKLGRLAEQRSLTSALHDLQQVLLQA
jgi:hypothetical protein